MRDCGSHGELDWNGEQGVEGGHWGRCVLGGVYAEREKGEGMCVGGDRVKKGMLVREKTDKDKACAVSWAMIYWLRLSLIYAYVWKGLQLMYSTTLFVGLFTFTTLYFALCLYSTVFPHLLCRNENDYVCSESPAGYPEYFIVYVSHLVSQCHIAQLGL